MQRHIMTVEQLRLLLNGEVAELDGAQIILEDAGLDRIGRAIQQSKSGLGLPVSPVLIWSNEHAAWWKDAEMGYTRTRIEAGQYPLVKAARIIEGANRFQPPGDRPNESMVFVDPEHEALQ